MIAASFGLALALRAMTVDDLWKFQRVGSPSLSPDGALVAFTVTVPQPEKNTTNSDIWIVPSDGSAPPRRLTWNEGADGNPVFSPDGKRLAFVSKRGDRPPQLYVLPLTGGEAERVTTLPVGVEDPKWFPDGKALAFVATTWPDLNDDFDAVNKRLDDDKDRVKARTSENRFWRYGDHDRTDGQYPHLFRIELASAAVTDLTPGSTRFMGSMELGGGYDIAPDGTELAFSANATEPPYMTLNYDIFTVKLRGSRTESVTRANLADDVRPRYTPDGRSIIYGRKSRPAIDSDFTRLARFDRRAGKSVEIAPSFDAEPSDWTLSGDGGLVYFHAESRGKVHIYAAPVSGGRPRAVVKGGTTGGVAVTKKGALVFTRQSLLTPAELWRARPDGTGQKALTVFNDASLREFDLGRVEDTTVKGAGGDDVQMFVVTPPGFDPAAGTTWPLVQLIHGGPHQSWVDAWSYRWNPLLFTAHGDVVAIVNFHGSMGSGQAFADSGLGANGDKPFTDVMNATDALIARGGVDPGRMAAAGGSYGGHLTAWILGHTDRFKALVVHAGVYDLMAQLGSDSAYGRATNNGADLWIDPARVDLYAPSRVAADFKTPTLILYGEGDYRVPYAQALDLYGVLTAKGVPARIVVFPDEDHWVLEAQSAKLWYGEVSSWIDRWLARAP